MTVNGASAPAAARILLDTPASHPGLRFAETAAAFAKVIEASEPRFAVGIFGDWGSGKTTLMDAIAAALHPQRSVIVQFNAWRYEQEPHLVVPLLDTVRAALLDWAGARERAPEAGQRVRHAAGTIARIVRALASGLHATVGLPGAVSVGLDMDKALQALGAGASDAPTEAPQSLYFAAFQQLASAFEEVTRGGLLRVVVFVDDLDRCLPANALDLIESMKLFFDLTGFVFVVGLDEDAVTRAVRTKMPPDPATPAKPGTDGTSTGVLPRETEREYIRKIFQVPYALPPIAAHQLDDLLASIYRTAGLAEWQLADLRDRVRRYLGYTTVEGRVNPREVKRFINAYTLQMIIRPELDRDTVLALQTLAFRRDWEHVYRLVEAESTVFADALRQFRAEQDESAFKDRWPELAVLHGDLARYLRSPAAKPLVEQPRLDEYIFSLQATTTTSGAQRWLSEVFGDVAALRRHLRQAGTEVTALGDSASFVTASAMSEVVSHMRRHGQLLEDRRIGSILEDLARAVGQLTAADPAAERQADRTQNWILATGRLVDRLQHELNLFRDG